MLLDLDGTLTDSASGIINCIEYALQKSGLAIPPRQRLYAWLGPTLHQSLNSHLNLQGEAADQVVANYRERFSEVGWKENALYPQALPLLEGLAARGYRMALATGKPEVFAVKILEHFGVARFFQHIDGTDFDGPRRQKEDVIQHIFQKTNAEAQHSLMIGDRSDDLRAAAHFGVEAVGVQWGYAQPGELEAWPHALLAQTPDAIFRFLDVR